MLRRLALGTFIGGYDDSLSVTSIELIVDQWLHGFSMMLVPVMYMQILPAKNDGHKYVFVGSPDSLKGAYCCCNAITGLAHYRSDLDILHIQANDRSAAFGLLKQNLLLPEAQSRIFKWSVKNRAFSDISKLVQNSDQSDRQKLLNFEPGITQKPDGSTVLLFNGVKRSQIDFVEVFLNYTVPRAFLRSAGLKLTMESYSIFP